MVKYVISFLIGFFFIITSVVAQEKYTPEWNFGVGFGPTFSTLSIVHNSTNRSVDTKNIQQFSYGFAVRYISEKNLGLIAELNYSQQGWKEDFGETSTTQKDIHKLNYLEVPLLTHIYFGNKIRFFVNLGPKFGYLLSESEEMSDVTLNGSTDSSGSIVENQYGKKVERKFDYGIMAGLGVEFRSKIGYFSLEGRYTLGLGDIYKAKKEDPFSRSANRVIEARLTYYTKIF